MNRILNHIQGYKSVSLKLHRHTLLSSKNIDNHTIHSDLDENLNYTTQHELETTGISNTLYGTYNIVEDDSNNVKKDCLKSFNERLQKIRGKNGKYTTL